MSTQLQFRRGNTSQHSSFTGAVGEVTVDTEKKVVVVHDGTTAGGIPAAKSQNSELSGNTSTSNLSVTNILSVSGTVNTDLIPSSNLTYSLGNNTHRWADLYLSGSTIVIGEQSISANSQGINFSGGIFVDNTQVANTSSFVLGANLSINTSAIFIGNTTVNTVINSSGITTGSLSGNGTSVTSVNAASVGGNTASDLLTYTDLAANTTYVNATSFASNADNISSGTLNTARLPGTANVSTAINVGANVNLTTGGISIGNSTVNSVISATGIDIDGTLVVANVVTFSNGLSMSNTLISNVGDPQNPQDAANKRYVDAVTEGLHVHAPCHAATSNTLAIISGGTVTYNNGTDGVGATLTLDTPITSLDNVSLISATSRIIVKNEANTAHNGIYLYSNSTVLTRASDYDTPTEMAGGDFVFVIDGTIYNSTGWVQIDPVNTVGTDPVVFVQFSGAGSYIAGDFLHLDGTEFNANANSSSVASVLVARDSSQNFSANVISVNTISATNGQFSGPVSGVTTLGAGNTTITGFANVSGSLSANTLSGNGASITSVVASSTTAALTAGDGLTSGGTFDGSTARTFSVVGNNGITSNSTGVFVNAGTGLFTNASGVQVNASSIDVGTVPTARLGSGTANSTTFLAGDQTYKTISAGVTSINSGNGLTGGPITSTGTLSVVANNGITSNTTGVFVNAGTGLFTNASGVQVNASSIAVGTVPTARLGSGTANSTTFLSGDQTYKTAVTQVIAGSGLFGGPITSSGELSVVGNNGLTSNSSGVFVNAQSGLLANSSGLYVNASSIAIGTVPTARLGSGTANSTTFLAGDQSYKTINLSDSTITTVDESSTAADHYPVFVAAVGSSQTAEASSTKLYFRPSTGILNATGFNSLSDINSKDNIETLDNSLSKVLQMRGVSFNWKDNGNKSLGVIAQEIENIVPEIVSENERGVKSVSYDSIVAILIEAIKEQNKVIEELKSKVERN